MRCPFAGIEPIDDKRTGCPECGNEDGIYCDGELSCHCPKCGAIWTEQ